MDRQIPVYLSTCGNPPNNKIYTRVEGRYVGELKIQFFENSNIVNRISKEQRVILWKSPPSRSLFPNKFDLFCLIYNVLYIIGSSDNIIS